MKNFHFLFFSFQLLVLFLILPFLVSAEAVLVEIDTEGETINALSGTLRLSSGTIVNEIYTGNSAVLIWITIPSVSPGGDTISFAGLSPGGFRGKYPLFILEGPSAESLYGITFEAIEAYRNDGEGTRASVSPSLSPSNLSQDFEPPEPFLPIISSSPDIFEGQHFLTFTVQDKGTGVDKIEYASSWFLKPKDQMWRPATAPQVLSKKELFQRLHVRAIDKEGNFRTVSTAGPYRYVTLIIGLIIGACVAFFITRSLSLSSSPSLSQ